MNNSPPPQPNLNPFIHRLCRNNDYEGITSNEIKQHITSLDSLISVCEKIPTPALIFLLVSKTCLYHLIKSPDDLEKLNLKETQLTQNSINRFASTMITYLRDKYQRHVNENAFFKIKRLSISFAKNSIFPDKKTKYSSPIFTLCCVLNTLNTRAKEKPQGASYKTLYSR